MTKDIGDKCEALAEVFLVQNGLQLSEKNFHSQQGEIDLIMHEQSILVFVEVKYRKNNLFGGPLSAVSPSKQKKIKQCATFYMHKHGLNEYNTPCRFDVIGLLGDINNPEITWLKNAF